MEQLSLFDGSFSEDSLAKVKKVRKARKIFKEFRIRFPENENKRLQTLVVTVSI